MIHIAICDDEQNFLDQITELVNKYAAEIDEEIKITTYLGRREFIEKYDFTIDWIFVDDKMRHFKGREIEKKVRQLHKPVTYASLASDMDTCLTQNRQEDNPLIIVSRYAKRYKVFLKDLRFAERDLRSVILHTEQGNIICSKKMDELERELSQHGFVRCHRMYIINLRYIESLQKSQAVLTTGEQIPISRNRKKDS